MKSIQSEKERLMKKHRKLNIWPIFFLFLFLLSLIIIGVTIESVLNIYLIYVSFPLFIASLFIAYSLDKISRKTRQGGL